MPLMISPEPAGDDIAVIGLACRFPGEASGPQEFWNLLCKGRCTYHSEIMLYCANLTDMTILQPPTHPPQNDGTSTPSTTPSVDD